MFWRDRIFHTFGLARRFASDSAFYSDTTMADSESDSRSFAAGVTPHTPTMLRVAAALVGVADAEDAAQEAILRAWQGWSGLRNHDALRSWLLRITVNVCQQWLRGELGKRKHLTLLDESAEWLASRDGGPGDSNHVAALDLRRALAQLKPELRTVIMLRYYGGMDAPEIGNVLGIPAGTVRTRLRRAHTHLRTHLEALPDAAAPATQGGDFHD